jgi:hypothetical protein
MVGAVGWSNESQQSAETMASERLEAAKRRVRRADPERRGSYPYSDGRPLQEEVVDRVPGVGSEPLAVVTRNAYGALVLNTTRVLFIDLDFACIPDERSFFKKLFSGQQSDQERALDHARVVASRYADWGFRVYRTAAGLRLVLLSKLVDAANDVWLQTLRAFGSDPMYVKLCETQRCFRARLTPKPWRFGLERPVYRFPFVTDLQRQYLDDWVVRYDAGRKGYATCEEIATIGSDFMPSDVRRVLDYHDQIAVQASKPLA